ncbi:hypothetical protein, partial [Mesorhizobium sp.]|uniref:hypothetical protein n=1 Tax=Mesorhizobium sp. TaxID=1871066 RepID=UPI0025CE584B
DELGGLQDFGHDWLRANAWLKPFLNPFLAKGKERPEVAIALFLNLPGMPLRRVERKQKTPPKRGFPGSSAPKQGPTSRPDLRRYQG